MNGVLLGYGLGFFVALQLGPMTLFLIRSTLRGGLRTGLAIGAGIACVDGLYAALGAAGAAPLLRVDALRVALGVAGASILLVLGARTLVTGLRVRMGSEAPVEIASARSAFVTSLAGTASNPLTILSWAGIFAAASAGAGAGAPQLVAGVALGSLTWVSVLALAISGARRALGPRALRGAEVLAGLGLIGFGGVLAYDASHGRG